MQYLLSWLWDMAVEGDQNASEEVSTSSSFPFQLPAARRVVECGLLSSLTAPFQVNDVSQSSKAEEK